MGSNQWDLSKALDIDGALGLSKTSNNGRKSIGKALRDQVWLKYMGNKAQGKCYCCKIRMIHITDFQVGHNKAVVKGGSDHISNLRPICGPCNRGMGTKSIEWYRKTYFSDGPQAKTPKKINTKKSKKEPNNPFNLGKNPFFN